MSNLTKAVRENMRKLVLDRAFKDREDEAKAGLIAAGDALYMAYHGQYLKAMQSLPKDFMVQRNAMCSNIGGQYHRVELSETKLMSYGSVRSNIVFAADHPQAIAYLKANNKVDDIEEQRNDMSRQVTAILESVRTFKKLWEVWPEAKPLLEHFEQKPSAAYLPAIQFDQINAKLGLPPGDKA